MSRAWEGLPKCGAKNYFANKCKQEVKVTEESDMYCEETYLTEEISVVRLDDSQLVTLQVECRIFIRFQPDKRPQCNVLPLHVYKQANDYKLEKVISVQTSFVAYGGSSDASP